MIVTLDLAFTDERALIRLLKRLLKSLGRVYGVRCKAIRVSEGEGK